MTLLQKIKWFLRPWRKYIVIIKGSPSTEDTWRDRNTVKRSLELSGVAEAEVFGYDSLLVTTERDKQWIRDKIAFLAKNEMLSSKSVFAARIWFISWKFKNPFDHETPF